MKQKIIPILLPTDIAGNQGHTLWTNAKGQLLHTKTSSNDLQAQHLYVTISQDVEPIKSGDWVYSVRGIVGKFGEFENSYENECRKIIATTDPKLLKTTASNYTRDKGVWGCGRVQQSFLKEFVANPDGEWEVEYEKIAAGEIRGIPTRLKINKLKLNQDNTVTITPVKEKMYNREEVIAFIKEVYPNEYINSSLYVSGVVYKNLDDWIEYNLSKI